MEANYPPGPPELPGNSGETTPPKQSIQLIASTRPAEPPVSEDDVAEPDDLNEHVEDPGDPDGVHAADEARRWQESHPEPQGARATARKQKRLWPRVLIIVVLLAAATVGAYWYGSHKADTPAPKASSNQTKTPTTAATKAATKATVTKHYDSVTYTLGFDYPETWTVSDTTAKLTILSPSLQLRTASGSTQNGHVVVTVQNQQTTIPSYPADGTTAALASDKLTYKQPTAVQRAQTYLSYVSYGKPNALDALYVTGDTGYQQGQQVPMSDVVKGNPLISITFVSCTTSDCASGTPTALSLLASSYKSASVGTAVTNLIQSIQLN